VERATIGVVAAALLIIIPLALIFGTTLVYSRVEIGYSAQPPFRVSLFLERDLRSSIVPKGLRDGCLVLKIPKGEFVLHIALANEEPFPVVVRSVLASGADVLVSVGGVPGASANITLLPGDGIPQTVSDARGVVHRAPGSGSIPYLEKGTPGATPTSAANFTWISLYGTIRESETKITLTILLERA